jgi:hypothetical protein
MRSPDQLRAEAYRLLDEAKRSLAPIDKQTLSARAFELAQEAEAIADLPADVEALHASVAHYRHMLADAENITKQRILTHVLQRAEDKLQQISGNDVRPKPHRRAVA